MVEFSQELVFSHVVVHHTGAQEVNAEQVRRYHLSLGWRDVGYHYLIEASGLVVKGRSTNLQGAHCLAGGMNRKAIGIALLGNFERTYPSFQQIRSLEGLLKSIMRQFAIPQENILLHRQVSGARTLCPGKNFPALKEFLPLT